MNDPRSATAHDAETPALPSDAHSQPSAGLSRPAQVIETAQTVLTALLLALIFRAFAVEAFIIPTGSMADSLLGAHGTCTCPACGWEYDFSASSSNDRFCPNCHLRTPPPPGPVPLKAGDRILVHKWPYVVGGMFGPRRWDVIVFRNPADPSESYIKRLVGLPGEALEIVDGDVFIDERIARKTPAAQRQLWFVVFDQNRHPHPQAPSAAIPRWVAQTPGDDPPQAWSGLETRIIRYRARDGRERSIRFQPPDQLYFQDVYAYNHGPSRSLAPYVADVRVLAELLFRAGDGLCRWELTRNGYQFLAETYRDGRVCLTMTPPPPADGPTLISEAALPPFRCNRPHVVEFGHLDWRVYLKVNGREVLSTTEAVYAPDLEVLRRSGRGSPVGLRIGAAGVEVELRGLRVDRDVHYTYRQLRTQRAYPDHPFVLGTDEYFVLGDNSPDSRDSREWTARGPHLPDDYRPGTVQGDQIVGWAAFVYLPGLLPLDSAGQWRLPDFGRARFVR